MIKKGLKYCPEFNVNPFIVEDKMLDISNLILTLSRSSLELMYYILDQKSFLDDKFVFDIDGFKNFANKKSDTSAIQALGELCSLEIIAKTKIARVYWVNRGVFLNEKEMGFLRKFLESKNKRSK
jgi:hypothetical protein